MNQELKGYYSTVAEHLLIVFGYDESNSIED